MTAPPPSSLSHYTLEHVMPDLTPGMVKLLGYWGTIQAAVGARLNTQELASAVENAQAAEGLTPGGWSAIDLGSLRSMAASQRNAMEALSAAPGSSPISADMVGVAPWSRGLNEQQLAQQWEVRFEHTTLQGDEQVTGWRTMLVEGGLPGSVDDLAQQIDDFGSQLANDYLEGHVSIGAIQITAV